MKDYFLWFFLAALSSVLIAGYLLPGPLPSTIPHPGEKANHQAGEFILYGDTRTNHDVHKDVVAQIRRLDFEFVINTGDLVEDGRKPVLWEHFRHIIGPLRDEYYPAVGNHEQWNRGGKSHMRKAFPFVPETGYYSIEKLGIRFVFVNQYEPFSADSKQYKWLENQLRTPRPVMVIMHEPHFQANHSANEKTREQLIPLLKRYQTTAVFYGHSHMFGLKREDDLAFIVTGGGGAPLYSPNPEELDKSIKEHHFIHFQRTENGLFGSVIGRKGETLYEFTLPLKIREEAAPVL
ncbi:MAG: metallophosphoesterase [Candidatus Acetothermia bacterium]